MTHHAYFYEGSMSAFGGYKKDLKPFWAREFERFGVDDARELRSLASLKHDRGSLFLIGAASITSEAQQALLKLFEEPQEGTVFVLLVPHGALLPTLRSRMLEYPKKLATAESFSPAAGRRVDASEKLSAVAVEFLAWPYKQRSDWITLFLKDEERIRERVRDFVNGLEVELYRRLNLPGRFNLREIREGLQDIGHFRQYLGDRSPSLKMILEHFAATLPHVSAEVQEKSARSGPTRP
ncbi:MAG: hypothetical protein Q7S26_04030 [bacterium]|nr:hypothetical protein [bacterium]